MPRSPASVADASLAREPGRPRADHPEHHVEIIPKHDLPIQTPYRRHKPNLQQPAGRSGCEYRPRCARDRYGRYLAGLSACVNGTFFLQGLVHRSGQVGPHVIAVGRGRAVDRERSSARADRSRKTLTAIRARLPPAAAPIVVVTSANSPDAAVNPSHPPSNAPAVAARRPSDLVARSQSR